jgi:hypothetical protein
MYIHLGQPRHTPAPPTGMVITPPAPTPPAAPAPQAAPAAAMRLTP